MYATYLKYTKLDEVKKALALFRIGLKLQQFRINNFYERKQRQNITTK